MPARRSRGLILVLAAIALPATPLAAESMREWAHQQDERALRNLQNSVYETHSSSSSSSSPSYGVSSAESDEQRAERLRLEAEQAQAQAKRWKELADYTRRVAAENAEVDRKWAQRRADEANLRRAQAEMEETRYRRWMATIANSRAAFAAHPPESPESQQAAREVKALFDEGSPGGTAEYGWLLIEGVRVAPDAAEGRKQLRRALGHGALPDAMMHYAQCLADGIGGPADELGGRAWYRAVIACKAPGNVVARRELALMEEMGRGSRPNVPSALRWYREAAALGDAWSRLRLAQMLRDGVGMPADPAAAQTAFADLSTCEDHEVADIAEIARKRLAERR
jgi:TPR repeat protein